MSKQFVPNMPYDIPAQHLRRETQTINGMKKEVFTPADTFFCSAKSYGGTEKVVNDITVIEDTWQIETWFNPAFKKGDRMRFLDDGSEYEFMATPENINRRGQYMRFKVKQVGGE